MASGTENLFFYHFVCHTCKSESEDLKKCTGCKLVSYCSTTHQKADWKNHKPFCQCIQILQKKWHVTHILGIEEKSSYEWCNVRLRLISCIKDHLSRPLTTAEYQMIHHSNVCMFCFSAAVSTDYKCDQCKIVYYCCKEHKDMHVTKHLLSCSNAYDCYVIDKYFLEEPKELLLKNIHWPFFEKDNFPDDIMTFLKMLSISNRIESIILSESMSGSLSIAFSVFTCLKLSLTSKNSILIHIIGASVYEDYVLLFIELLFHCMSSVDEFSIFLIGPEFSGNASLPNLCEICKNKKISIKSSKSLYCEFALTSEEFKKPDIIVALNCGFCEFSDLSNDTWKATLAYILSLNNFLFMFTSYNKEESFQDMTVVKSQIPKEKNVSFNKKCYENPFRSYRPHRENENEGIFYFNNYISIIEIE